VRRRVEHDAPAPDHLKEPPPLAGDLPPPRDGTPIRGAGDGRVRRRGQPPREPAQGGIKKAKKATRPKKRAGEKAQEEVAFYQGTTHLLIPPTAFKNLVRDIVQAMHPNAGLMMKADAVAALQHASEAVLVGMFEDAQVEAGRAGRSTVMRRDVALARRFRDLA